MKKNLNNDDTTLTDFVENEKKELIDFFSNFNIIGLTIASVIGLAVSSLSKTFTNEIVMPLIEPYFSANWKTFTMW